MIVGIGIDLIKIQRIKEAIERGGERFLKKVFTTAEIQSALEEGDKNAFFAMRFAAKESILKAFGIGWTGVKGTDVEIVRGKLGEPVVKLSKKLQRMMIRMSAKKVLLSMSYDSEYAVAVAVLVGDHRISSYLNFTF
jgi:holo-[acyl-carrier protein] synthase